MNSKLEEDSRELMIQMKTVLEQNQDLLDQMLNNKDNFHAQQKELKLFKSPIYVELINIYVYSFNYHIYIPIWLFVLL